MKTNKAISTKERIKFGKIAAIVGIISNIVLFSAKILIGVLSGAISIVADGVNNLSDVSSSVVSLLGFKLSEKPADAEHPYGHARFEYISGMVVATTILFIGFELVKSSVEKIISPSPVTYSAVTVVVLFLSVVVKTCLYIFNKKIGKSIDSATLQATATDSRNDALSTSAVLIALAVSAMTDINLDGYVGLCVAVFVILSSVQLMKDTVNLLLGMGADPDLRKVIIDTVRENDKVLGCHDLMVHDYGPGQCFASIHIEMDKNEDVMLCHEIIDNIERTCFENHGVHLVAHLDPVVTGDEKTEYVHSFVQDVLFDYSEDLKIHDFRMIEGTDATKLVFDVILPENLESKKWKIQQFLEESLEKSMDEKYSVFITFDPPEIYKK